MLARQRDSFKRGNQSKLLRWTYAANITKIPAIVWLDFVKQRLVTANQEKPVKLFVINVSLQGRVNPNNIVKVVWNDWPLAEIYALTYPTAVQMQQILWTSDQPLKNLRKMILSDQICCDFSNNFFSRKKILEGFAS